MPRRPNRVPAPALARCLLAALAVLAMAVAVPALGSPQPRPVTPLGDDTLVSDAPYAAGDGEYPVTSSEAELRIREDGSGRWVVTAVLANESDAAAFRDDPERLQGTVYPAVRAYEPIPHVGADSAVSNVSATIDGRTVTVTYDVSNVATRTPFGPTVVTYFDTTGSWYYHVHVDRLVVVGPAGTTVANGPTVGTADGRRLTIDETRQTSFRPLDGLELVYDDADAAATDDERSSSLRVQAAIAFAERSTIAANLAMLAIPAAILAMLLAGFAGTGGALKRVTDSRLAAIIGVLGALAVLGAVVPSTPLTARDPFLVGGLAYLAIAGVVLLTARRRYAIPFRALAALVVVGPALWIVGAALVGAGVESPGSLLQGIASVVLVLSPLPAFGHAVSRGQRRGAAVAGATALATVFAVYVGSADLTEPAGGLFWPILAGIAVVGLALAWYRAFVLGYVLGGQDGARPGA